MPTSRTFAAGGVDDVGRTGAVELTALAPVTSAVEAEAVDPLTAVGVVVADAGGGISGAVGVGVGVVVAVELLHATATNAKAAQAAMIET